MPLRLARVNTFKCDPGQHDASLQRYLKQVIWDLPNTMTGFTSKDHHCCFMSLPWFTMGKYKRILPLGILERPNGFERMLAVLLRACVDSNLETDSENT